MTDSPVALAGLVTLLLLVAAAVRTDLRERRIPNRLVLTGLAVAVVLHVVALATGLRAPAGPNAWSPLAGALAGMAFLLPLYLMRACGAGDVKLMAMVGAFVGVNAALSAGLYTLAAGGVLSVAYMALRGITTQTLANVRFILTDWRQRAAGGQGVGLAPLATTAGRLPYALAIAAGTLLACVRPLALVA